MPTARVGRCSGSVQLLDPQHLVVVIVVQPDHKALALAADAAQKGLVQLGQGTGQRLQKNAMTYDEHVLRSGLGDLLIDGVDRFVGETHDLVLRLAHVFTRGGVTELTEQAIDRFSAQVPLLVEEAGNRDYRRAVLRLGDDHGGFSGAAKNRMAHQVELRIAELFPACRGLGFALLGEWANPVIGGSRCIGLSVTNQSELHVMPSFPCFLGIVSNLRFLYIVYTILGILSRIC